ncbi:MAG TPA: TonB-dependent receptor plug domain-containing protein, partial [Halioglobus sp.]
STVLAAALLGVIQPYASSAQETAGALEEIVVTAQRREQLISEVPLSIQAFTDGMLDSAHIRELSELMNFVPGASEGLSVSLGQRQYQMRGISTNNLGDPTIGYYVDDAAFFIYGEPYAPVGRTFDIQRVEVLRGPQSTLYGNGSMGGTIRYITEPPDLRDFAAFTRAGYAQTDGGDPGYYADAMLGIPLLQDRLGLRLAGGYEEVGGYQQSASGESDTNEGKLDSVRTSLIWEPADSLELKFLYAYNRADQDGSATLSSLDPPIATAEPGDYTDRNYSLYSTTLAWDSAIGKLSTTTTWIDNQSDALFNSPFAAAPGGKLEATYATNGDAFNNETRLVSTSDGPAQWLIGSFYSDTSTKQETLTNVPQFVPDSVQDLNSKAISLFGEISRQYMNNTMVPLLGVRYFDDDRDTSISNITSQPEKKTFDSINPRFNLSIFPNETALYYVNIVKGFRSGNFNNPNVCALQRQPVEQGGGGLPCEDAVDSDELWSYETGTKLVMLEGQLSLDAAFYYEDWSDVREAVQFSGLYQDYQVGDAEIYGVDLSMILTPASLKGLTVQAMINVNSSELKNLNSEIEAASGMQDGDRVPLVPESTVSLTGNYSWSLGGGWSGQATVGYSHIDKQYGQFGTTEAGDRRDLLRMRVGAEDERFGLWLFGSNLLEESGAIYVQNPPTGLSFSTQDYPRQIGIEVSYRY